MAFVKWVLNHLTLEDIRVRCNKNISYTSWIEICSALRKLRNLYIDNPYVSMRFRSLWRNFETNMFWLGTASSIVVRSLATWSVFVHGWNLIKRDHYFPISLGGGAWGINLWQSSLSSVIPQGFFYEKGIITVIILCTCISWKFDLDFLL